MVGIDLGTTHTLLAYAELTRKAVGEVELFEIEQLVAPGEVTPRVLFPSMRYHPAADELSADDQSLPWALADPAGVSPLVLGELARALGSQVPGRLVTSAKSWLSHPAVDRGADILPWGGLEGVAKVSPIDASASYLRYLRDAWNQSFAPHRLENQELVLTVPASFDEAARALTVEAAKRAGLVRLRLLEEPQAACYDWIHRHREALREALADVRLLLVVDVGGGTTDLTLIRVSVDGETPVLERVGVGDHLMLGGDNMDMALAHLVEQRLGGVRLNAASLSQLLQQCRAAKERLLASEPPESATVTLVGSGARLVGGARSAKLGREEVDALIVDGFFPRVTMEDHPHGRRGAIVEFGLPYAADAAVTRHVAAFLAKHAHVSAEAVGDAGGAGALAPDAVLLNGGVFSSHALTQRLMAILESWRQGPVRQLHLDDPMTAVARGAVAYAIARRGHSTRIGGGAARSYFLVLEGAEGEQQAVCLLPRGTPEGQEIVLEGRTFALRLGEPVGFQTASLTGDHGYRSGELISTSEADFVQLPPIATVLEDGGEWAEVDVQLSVMLTEVGTLDVSCLAVEDRGRRWHLAFQLRGTAAAFIDEPEHPRLAEAAALIERLYGTRSKDVGPKEIRGLRSRLEGILGARESWRTVLLRRLFAELWEGARRRRRSSYHERLWLSLVGFCLRPGFGYPLDDWRVGQLWSLHRQGIQYKEHAQNWSEWWTLWRRVCGGLDETAHRALLADVATDLRPVRRGAQPAKGARARSYDDMVRLVGSLERLPADLKAEVGDVLLRRLESKGEPPETWWAVGRLGSRAPLFGSTHAVVPTTKAERWIEAMLALDWKGSQVLPFAAAQLTRLSGDRERDMDPDLRRRVAERLRQHKAPKRWVSMVESVVELDAADEQRAFGESLPPGLRLVD